MILKDYNCDPRKSCGTFFENCDVSLFNKAKLRVRRVLFKFAILESVKKVLDGYGCKIL